MSYIIILILYLAWWLGYLAKYRKGVNKMVDLRGTAPTRPDYTDSRRANKAVKIVERCKKIEKRKNLVYWIKHKKRGMALSGIRYRALGCSRILATGSASSENKERTDTAKAFIDNIK